MGRGSSKGEARAETLRKLHEQSDALWKQIETVGREMDAVNKEYMSRMFGNTKHTDAELEEMGNKAKAEYDRLIDERNKINSKIWKMEKPERDRAAAAAKKLVIDTQTKNLNIANNNLKRNDLSDYERRYWEAQKADSERKLEKWKKR